MYAFHSSATLSYIPVSSLYEISANVAKCSTMWQNITRKSSIDYNRKHSALGRIILLLDETHGVTFGWDGRFKRQVSRTNPWSNSASWEHSESKSLPWQCQWASMNSNVSQDLNDAHVSRYACLSFWIFWKPSGCESVLHSMAGLSWREFHAHILQTNTGYRNQNSQKWRMSLDITPSQNIWISSKW